MTHLTTHVLDAAAGAPASEVPVGLVDDRGAVVATGVTDADGEKLLHPEAYYTLNELVK